jgi:diaminohydroxyphosphoribosylaminopyrimidine deaminase/5-amino-6-(5-phosphoribosylamino)uracil reductase
MRRAIEASRDVVGATSPNPPVGALVLTATGEPAAVGVTAPPGGPHAEVVALTAAGEAARGGTVVVTLEPCAHTGRTGPCTEAIVAAGARRVVYAADDPHPAAGGGAAALRGAGIDVESGVLAEDVQQGPLEAWLHFVQTGRPFVTWKYAASFDGRVAAPDGSSRWVSGPEARADAHRLRAQCDAIAVGIGTVLADDPRLTVRDVAGNLAPRQPLRVVLDTSGRTPAEAAVLDEAAPTLVLTAADLPVVDGRLDPHAVLGVLHDRGIVHVLLEGGPTVAMSFVAAGLVDRIVGYIAPILIGGGGLPALGGEGAPSVDKAWAFDIDEVTRVGNDLRVVARPVRG